MDYETQVLATELDNYREDLVRAYDHLHANPYHTFIKMPYAEKTSALLEGFQFNNAEEIRHRVTYARDYDQQNAFNELLDIFRGHFSNMSEKGSGELAGYIVDILNETYKSKFFSPLIFNLRYTIWFQAEDYSNRWHLDGFMASEACDDSEFSLIYPLKGPSTLFNDPYILLNGLEFNDKCIYNDDHDYSSGLPFSFFNTLNYSPVEVECAQIGHASIHTFNSIHSVPAFHTPRVVLVVSLTDKDDYPFYNPPLNNHKL